ncbi:MFS transporter [Cumulibacter manganitolerans]|uniref:MFS transporter n=1 Tax=Cumulibacter manganitolerans TaxID=1884992 RepID=UPI001E5000A2|nr:MFS transporter [Cumulibacter manganitolerans]
MSTQETAGPAARMTGEQRKLLVAILVPLFMSLLSISIVNVTLPTMQTSLRASDQAIQWVLSGYTLAFGVVMVAAGRAGDLYGRGRLFMGGLVVFGLGSLLSGLAPDPVVLNLARVLMGLGSGLLSPQGVGMIQQFFSGKARGIAFGMFGSVVGVSVAIGPVLGGVLVLGFGDQWGWRTAMLINVPIAAIAMVVGRIWMPSAAWTGPAAADRAQTGPRPKVDLDPVGVALLGVAILFIMLPFLERSIGPAIYVLLVVGAALIVVWVRWERRYAARGGAPMVDLQLFRTPSFAYGSTLAGVFFMGLTSVWVVSALYLQNGLGFSALASGLMGVPSAVFSAIVPQITGRIVFTYGRKLVVAGIGVALIGVVASIGIVLAHESHGISPWWLMLTLSFIGISQGMVISPNQALTLAEVPVEYAGSSGGIMSTGQRVGTAIGIAIITAAFFVALDRGYDTAFIAAYGAIGVFIALAGVVGLIDLASGRARRRVAQREPA